MNHESGEPVLVILGNPLPGIFQGEREKKAFVTVFMPDKAGENYSLPWEKVVFLSDIKPDELITATSTSDAGEGQGAVVLVERNYNLVRIDKAMYEAEEATVTRITADGSHGPYKLSLDRIYIYRKKRPKSRLSRRNRKCKKQHKPPPQSGKKGTGEVLAKPAVRPLEEVFPKKPGSRQEICELVL